MIDKKTVLAGVLLASSYFANNIADKIKDYTAAKQPNQQYEHMMAYNNMTNPSSPSYPFNPLNPANPVGVYGHHKDDEDNEEDNATKETNIPAPNRRDDNIFGLEAIGIMIIFSAGLYLLVKRM